MIVKKQKRLRIRHWQWQPWILRLCNWQLPWVSFNEYVRQLDVGRSLFVAALAAKYRPQVGSYRIERPKPAGPKTQPNLHKTDDELETYFQARRNARHASEVACGPAPTVHMVPVPVHIGIAVEVSV